MRISPAAATITKRLVVNDGWSGKDGRDVCL